MNKDKYPMYAVAGVAAVGIAVWAGISPLFLLLLACPVMMLFMMGSMSGSKGDNHVNGDGDDADSRTPTRPDRSHDRNDLPRA